MTTEQSDWPASCTDVQALLERPVRCCESCHEDWERDAYEMVWIDLRDERHAHVCCTTARAARERPAVVA